MEHNFTALDTFGRYQDVVFTSKATSYETLVNAARRLCNKCAILLTLDGEPVPYRYQVA
jgi:hypothetical protein